MAVVRTLFRRKEIMSSALRDFAEYAKKLAPASGSVVPASNQPAGPADVQDIAGAPEDPSAPSAGPAGLDTGSAVAGPASAGPSPPSLGGAGALEATSTVLYFEINKANLTPSDINSLDAYVAAFRAADSHMIVSVQAFASKEGDELDNQDLSERRAKAVAKYLEDHGVLIVNRKGLGPTGDFGDDLRQNRRATLSPPPETFAPKVKDPEPTPDDKKQPKPIPGVPDDFADRHPRADVVTRELVRKSLVPWLEKLGESQLRKLGKWKKNQKIDKVESTGVVYHLEKELRTGVKRADGSELPPNSRYTKDKGTGRSYSPDELAGHIADELTPTIPRENLLNALKLPAEEAPKETSPLEKLRNKAGEAADHVCKDFGLSKEHCGTAKEFIKNRLPAGIDKLPIPDGAKDAFKKIIQDDKGQDDK
jgi:outer membrane protein OmpA-like peptidoglycan-associated protein